jgi:hypothetical protein
MAIHLGTQVYQLFLSLRSEPLKNQYLDDHPSAPTTGSSPRKSGSLPGQ